MATILNMPQITNEKQEFVIHTCCFKQGDSISEGDILIKIDDGNNSLFSLKASSDGVISFLAVQENQVLPVGELLLILGEENEDVLQLLYKAEASKKKFLKTGITASKPKATIVLPLSYEEDTLIRMSERMYKALRKEDEWRDKLTWNKKEGDKLEYDDIVQAVPCPIDFRNYVNEGNIVYVTDKDGLQTKVGELLAILGPKDPTFLETLKEITSNDLTLKKLERLEYLNTPQLENGILENIITIDCKRIGDVIEVNDVLITIETERMILTFLSPRKGYLRYVFLNQGQFPQSNNLLAILEPVTYEPNKKINDNLDMEMKPTRYYL